MATEWSSVCVKLLQGPLYEDENSSIWKLLLKYQRQISDYFEKIGLSVFVEQSDGYAFLEQIEDDEGEAETLRLIKRYPLSFEQSLLCVLLREVLEDFDASQSRSPICVISETEIRNRLSVYFKEKTDQTKLYREFTRYLNETISLGFLKEVPQPAITKNTDAVIERQFEVRRILRAKITTEFLAEFKEKITGLHDKEKSALIVE